MKTFIIAAIDSERDHQDRKYPRHKHTPGEYLLILRKLLKDAERVWYKEPHSPHHFMAEIRQITAVGVKAMEEHGAPLRPSPEEEEDEDEGVFEEGMPPVHAQAVPARPFTKRPA